MTLSFFIQMKNEKKKHFKKTYPTITISIIASCLFRKRTYFSVLLPFYLILNALCKTNCFFTMNLYATGLSKTKRISKHFRRLDIRRTHFFFSLSTFTPIYPKLAIKWTKKKIYWTLYFWNWLEWGDLLVIFFFQNMFFLFSIHEPFNRLRNAKLNQNSYGYFKFMNYLKYIKENYRFNAIQDHLCFFSQEFFVTVLVFFLEGESSIYLI